jgi:hypothetical protein
MGRTRGNSLVGYINSGQLEGQFASGKHPEALLEMIFICCLADIPIPPWAREAFKKAYIAGECEGIGSWNKVFGPPRTKGQWQRLMRNLAASRTIWDLVSEAKNRNEPIGDELFLKIGKQLGIGSKTLVSELYSEMCRVLGRPTSAPQNPAK